MRIQMSWRITAWMTASISMSRARTPATLSIVPYSTREPGGGQIGARRRVHEFADLAGDPDGGVCDPFGDAAHHIVAGRAGDVADRARHGAADVADHR